MIDRTIYSWGYEALNACQTTNIILKLIIKMITLLQDIFLLSPLTRERERIVLSNIQDFVKEMKVSKLQYILVLYIYQVYYICLLHIKDQWSPLVKQHLSYPTLHNGLLMYWTVGAPGVDPPVSQEDRSFSTDHDRQGCERESSSLIKRPVVWGQIHSHCASFTFSSFKE